RFADGDSAAFDTLYRRFARPILGLALRLLRDRSRAEDAVQETFAAIWRSAGSYRPERGPGAPWLYAVARNAIVDRARARRDATFADPPETASADAGPADRAESAYVAWRVHRAVVDLPPNEREGLELAYWGNPSPAITTAAASPPCARSACTARPSRRTRSRRCRSARRTTRATGTCASACRTCRSSRAAATTRSG